MILVGEPRRQRPGRGGRASLTPLVGSAGLRLGAGEEGRKTAPAAVQTAAGKDKLIVDLKDVPKNATAALLGKFDKTQTK